MQKKNAARQLNSIENVNEIENVFDYMTVNARKNADWILRITIGQQKPNKKKFS